MAQETMTMNEELKPTSADDPTFARIVRQNAKNEPNDDAVWRRSIEDLERLQGAAFHPIVREALAIAFRSIIWGVRSAERPSITAVLRQNPCRRDAAACAQAYQGMTEELSKNILDRIYFRGKKAALWTYDDCTAAAREHAHIEGIHAAAKQLCMKFRDKMSKGKLLGECVTAREALAIVSECERLAKRRRLTD